MKVAIFTYLFSNYDQWQEPSVVNEDYDYFIYTDDPDFRSEVYDVEVDTSRANPIKKARRYKLIKGYRDLCALGYDVIISHDASMSIIADLQPLIDEQITDMTLLKHPNRNCIYEEYGACCDAYPPKDDIYVMQKQVQRYANDGYGPNMGMIASGVMIRKNNKRVDKICKAWAMEVEHGSIRDQLSANYIFWKYKFKFDMIPFVDTLTHFFDMRKHIRQ